MVTRGGATPGFGRTYFFHGLSLPAKAACVQSCWGLITGNRDLATEAAPTGDAAGDAGVELARQGRWKKV